MPVLPAQLMDRQELKIAVDWWGMALLGHIKNNTQEAKNIEHAMSMLGVAMGKTHPWDKPSPDQVVKFMQALLALYAVRAADTWYEDEPNRASLLRIIATDYGPDKVLHCALEFAGVQGTVELPIKTMMWVNPGSVKVRVGGHSEEVTLYKK